MKIILFIFFTQIPFLVFSQDFEHFFFKNEKKEYSSKEISLEFENYLRIDDQILESVFSLDKCDSIVQFFDSTNKFKEGYFTKFYYQNKFLDTVFFNIKNFVNDITKPRSSSYFKSGKIIGIDPKDKSLIIIEKKACSKPIEWQEFYKLVTEQNLFDEILFLECGGYLKQ
ncbi:hypothetical protein [Aquimarina sp. Aq78]|uniref:hypothetical protein n=1 Tax=Aquimarina sp. Aq78 TaxID=1191889 RepID=UPI00131B49D6|nr:hypothetical protein [Aquimarina sp. Aq78]